MSAGLAASTVTPGRIAPDVSLTTPASEDCADATAGSMDSTPRITATRNLIIRTSNKSIAQSGGSAIERSQITRPPERRTPQSLEIDGRANLDHARGEHRGRREPR